jgi:heptosyltransferase-2
MTYSLVIQTSFLGDVVLTTGLLTALARRGPVDVVTTPAAAPLLSGHPAVREVVIYDKRKADAGMSGLVRIGRLLRERRDQADDDAVAYMAQGSLRSASLAILAGFRHRVGFDSSAGRSLYSAQVPYDHDSHHAVRLLRLGGFTPADASATPSLYPGIAERTAVDELLAAAGAGNDPLMAYAPGSAWATKRWPGYPALAHTLRELGRPVVVGGADDDALARQIVDATGGDAIDATGKLSLLASAELIARCRALVTNDSAPQHLASAMGTPTVTIFGPTVPAFGFGPLAPGSESVGHDTLPCRPCHKHGPPVCPLGHWNCMRELALDSVAGAVRRVAKFRA